MAEKLMRKSGAWAQLADVPGQVRAGIANAPMRSQLLPVDLARLERSADAAFSADRLRSSALRVLAAELSPSHATEAMGWYSSPTGLMITALEEAASHEFTDLNAALQDGNAALAAATPERQTLIIRLVRATRSVDSSVNTMVHSMAGQRLVDAMVKAFDNAFFSAAKEFGRLIMITPKIGTKGQL